MTDAATYREKVAKCKQAIADHWQANLDYRDEWQREQKRLSMELYAAQDMLAMLEAKATPDGPTLAEAREKAQQIADAIFAEDDAEPVVIESTDDAVSE